MGQRVLADKKIKLTILTAKPANETSPTIAELNAGIEACMKVLYDGFQFSAVDSATQSGKMLCGSNEEAFTDENFALGFTVARQYLAGGIDPPATRSSRPSAARHDPMGIRPLHRQARDHRMGRRGRDLPRRPLHDGQLADAGHPGVGVLPRPDPRPGRVAVPHGRGRRLTH